MPDSTSGKTSPPAFSRYLNELPQNPDHCDTVLVVGATVLDRIFYVESLPRPGETSIGHRMEMHPGGKGANQALAARKMGADVMFISAVGDDHPGEAALQPLVSAGVNTEGVIVVPSQPTAEAVISVDANGENQITACPGAYHHLRPEHLDRRLTLFRRAKWLLIQNELPNDTIHHAFTLAVEHGLKIIFNPDPFMSGSARPPRGLHAIIPNELQATDILGVHNYEAMPNTDRPILWSGIGALHVVITLGAKGVEWIRPDGERVAFPAHPCEAIDSVGAGDAFCGALTAFIAEGIEHEAAIGLANIAAGLSVQHRGAQAGLVSREDLLNLLD